MRNTSDSYDKLSQFSERLLGLAAMFEQPVEGVQFDRMLPEIRYQIHMIRNLEYFVKERIFRWGRVHELFAKADVAVYHAETCTASGKEYCLAISKELTAVAILAGKMAMEGYARQEKERERQKKLGGP